MRYSIFAKCSKCTEHLLEKKKSGYSTKKYRVKNGNNIRFEFADINTYTRYKRIRRLPHSTHSSEYLHRLFSSLTLHFPLSRSLSSLSHPIGLIHWSALATKFFTLVIINGSTEHDEQHRERESEKKEEKKCGTQNERM